MIRSLAGLAFANAAFFAAGAGIVRLFGWRLRTHPGLAYMSGISSVGVLSTLMLMAGLALRWWQILILCALLASLGLVTHDRPEPTSAKTDWRLALPFGGLLSGYLVVLFVQCVFQPLNSWDAWAKWTMKARAIVLLGGLDTSVFANHAYQPLVLDYPMLIPGLEAIDFRFMGRLDSMVIHVQFWLLLVGFLVAAYELLRDRVPQALLWPTLLLVGTAPALADNLTSVFIMSKKWAEAHNATKPQDFKNKEENYAVRNANGTGPFVLVSREPDVKTVLKRNDAYWGRKDVPLADLLVDVDVEVDLDRTLGLEPDGRLARRQGRQGRQAHNDQKDTLHEDPLGIPTHYHVSASGVPTFRWRVLFPRACGRSRAPPAASARRRPTG